MRMCMLNGYIVKNKSCARVYILNVQLIAYKFYRYTKKVHQAHASLTKQKFNIKFSMLSLKSASSSNSQILATYMVRWLN